MNAPTDPFADAAASYAEDRAPALLRSIRKPDPIDPFSDERLVTLEITRAFLAGSLHGLEVAREAVRKNLTP